MKISPNTINKTINFSNELHDEVMRLAEYNERTFSWMVKKAVSKYVKDSKNKMEGEF